MNDWLLFLVKSTLVFSLLYLLFRLLMRNETYFRICRFLLLCIVCASLIIPFIQLPMLNHPVVAFKSDPVLHSNSGTEFHIVESYVTPYSAALDSTIAPPEISTKTFFMFIYLTGIIISSLILVYNIFTVLRLFKKSRKITHNSIQIWISNVEIPAFSFTRHILISQDDYYTNADAIITHESSHIKLGHFYDLLLLEVIKMIYWFNPLVYKMIHDMKDIHEFQADELTLKSGVDLSRYQLLIIQKCVGHQLFALANSFNQCQIKKRITMMNKSKTSKAGYWKLTSFLPAVALLLMAFGKMDENIPVDSTIAVTTLSSSVADQMNYEQFKRKIEIKSEGNFIGNKICSLQEIAKQGEEWYKTGNDWILLLVDESVPSKRIDEVREALVHDYWIVQTVVNSDDLVYFSGDVSEATRFSQGNFDEWTNQQIGNAAEIEAKDLKYTISYSFIVGKDGKVRDAHITKHSYFPEIDAAYEKMLSQIPDWEPAKRDGMNISVMNRFSINGILTSTEKE